jgi:AI-2 transport protein TqsA
MEQARGENPSGLTRSSQTILAFAAITGLLYYGQPVLVPFVLAVFIFAMFSSTLDWLVLRLRFPQSLALTVSFCLVLIVTLLVFLIVGEAIRRVVVTATSYSDSLSNMADRVFTRVTQAGLKMDPEVFLGDIRGTLSAIAAGVAGRSLDAISTFVLVLIFLFFLMASRDPRAIRTGVYASIDREVRRYLILKTLLSAILGVAQGGILWLFGVELAPVFGLLAFVLDFIPSIGPLIATVLPIPLAIAHFPDSLWNVGLIVALLVVIQNVQGNLIEPKVLGTSMHLHPITILLAIGFWGLVWGLIGAFLAVPLTAIIRLISLRIDALRPLGRLLGGRIPEIDKPAIA